MLPCARSTTGKIERERERESGNLVRESESVDIFVGSNDDRVDDPFIKT